MKEIVSSVLKILYNRIGEVMSTGKQVSFAFKNIGRLTSDRKIVEFVMEKEMMEPVELRVCSLYSIVIDHQNWFTNDLLSSILKFQRMDL